MDITADIATDIATDITAEVAIEVISRTELNLNYGSGNL